MSYELRTDDEVGDDVTLTLGSHPDGELAFKDGTAIVDDETLAQRLAERYPHLEYAGEANAADSNETTSVDSLIDPCEFTIDDLGTHLEQSDYSDEELEAIRNAEKDGKNRDGAISAIKTALEG